MELDKIANEILKCCDKAQILIIELYEKYPYHKAFEQGDLINGSITVYEYVYYGEYEIAIDHLLYMIYNGYIDYLVEERKKVHSLSNMKDFYFKNSIKPLLHKENSLLSNQSFSNERVENLKLEYEEYKRFTMETTSKNIIKTKMKEKGIEGKELAKRLKMKEATFFKTLKLDRFTATFFFDCMKALDIKILKEEDWQ